MENKDGSLYFTAGIDRTKWKADLDKMRAEILGIEKTANNTDINFGITKENIAIQKQVIADIKAQMKEIEKAASDMAPGIAQASVIAEIKPLREELAAEEKALSSLEVEMKKNAVTATTLSSKYLTAKNILAELTLANKQGTPEFAKAEAEVKKLGLALNETNKNAKNLSSGGGFSAIIQGASLLSGGLAATNSIMGVFGGENENLNKIMVKTQALLSVSITLQQLQTSVTTGGILSTTSLTTAKNYLATANLRLATALGISTAAARILLGTLTLGLAVAIPVVVTLLSNYIDKQKEAAKSQNELNKAMQEGVVAAADDIVQLKILYSAATNVALSTKERERNVRELQKAFPEHFGNIDKEIILNGQAKKSYDDLVGSIIAASKARALEKVLTERQEALFRKQEQLRKERDGFIDDMKKSSDREIDTGNGIVLISGDDAKRNNRNKAIQKEKEAMQAELQFNKEQKGLLSEINRLKQEGRIDSDIENPKNAKTTVAKSKNPTGSPAPKPEEILLDGSLADLRNKLSEIEQAFSKTNNEITRDTLNQEKLVIEAQIKAIEDKYVIKEDEAAKEKAELEKKLQDFLVSQRNYEEKVIALKEGYARLRSVATTDEERTKIDAGLQEDLQKLASDELKKSKAWIDAFGEIEIYAAQKLSEVRAALLAELQRMEAAGTATPEAVKALQDQLKKIDAQIVKSRSSFAIIRQSIKDFGDESKTTEEKIKSLLMGVAAAKSTLSDLKDIGSGVSDIFAELGGNMDSAFGDVLTSIQDSITGLEQFAEGAGQALEGLASGNILQTAAGAIKAIGGLVKSVGAWMSGDKKKEREIKKQQAALKELERTYNDLGRAINNALGDKFFDASKQGIENLKQQQNAINEMIRQEESKKKKNRDNDKIADWKQQLRDIDNTIAEIGQSISDKILNGLNAKGLAEQLSDAFVSAFRTGEDSAEAMGKTVDKILADMVNNALRMKLLEGPMQSVVDKMLSSMGYDSNGNGTFDGLTDQERQDIKNMITTSSQNYANALQEYKDLFGAVGDVNEGMKGDIKGITEKTAGALESQINTMRIYQAEALAIHRNNQLTFLNSLNNLIAIEFNTRRLHNIDSTLVEMNGKMTKGLAGLG